MEGIGLGAEVILGFGRFGATGDLTSDEGSGCAAGLRPPDFFYRKTLLEQQIDSRNEDLPQDRLL